MITFNFYGTSHGEGYGGTIKGLPNGISVDVDYINQMLKIRKGGVGRSSRQTNVDTVTFVGHEGQKKFCTDGADLIFTISNACVEKRADITAVRTGHADLVGQKRYPNMTARDVAEIASARSSVCYVVLGCVCQQILLNWDISTEYYVNQIGSVVAKGNYLEVASTQIADLPFPCVDANSSKLMQEEILQARERGDSLGGVVCVIAHCPAGLGEVFPYHKRLDAQISAQLVGIPSVKGIAFGLGYDYAGLTGVEAHDKLELDNSNEIVYQTNKCGGIVGGITTGNDIVINLTVKPVPTIKGVKTIDTKSLQEVNQHYERADTCVVPTVGLIATHLLNYVLANQVLKQFEENPNSLPKKA